MWKDEALQHAISQSPYEACGLIYIFKGRERYVKSKNISTNPKELFTIDPVIWAETEDKGEIVGIFHSHPTNSPRPSKADIIAADKSGIKWHIVNPHTEEWFVYTPIQKTNLLGREWIWGVQDCYTLVRDWYKEQGIVLKDWVRTDQDNFNSSPIFDSKWKETGFRELKYNEPLKVGDSLLFSLLTPGLNHVGVYVNQGQILHHVQGRLSSREEYSEYLQKCTGRRLRHASFD